MALSPCLYPLFSLAFCLACACLIDLVREEGSEEEGGGGGGIDMDTELRVSIIKGKVTVGGGKTRRAGKLTFF